MAKLGKWLGGGIGWALGGPLGALFGFFIGSIFDKAGSAQSLEGRHTTTAADFRMSLLVMIACVMKADGQIKKSELNVVKRFLVSNFGEEEALEALQMLKQLLDQPINEAEVAMQISQHMNYSAKLQLIHLLFNIAYSDGEIHSSELIVIERIAGIFHISQLDFNALKAPYIKTTDVNWAYQALEIEPTASDEEIKKAYRRMAMKFHPDKVHNLGEEMKKSATEKFRAVNEAYESLKKQRNFN